MRAAARLRVQRARVRWEASWGWAWVSTQLLPSPQEAPQEAGPAGLASGGHHSHRAPHCGEVRPTYTHPVPALLHLSVLDTWLRPGAHLDHLALFPAVSGPRSISHSSCRLSPPCPPSCVVPNPTHGSLSALCLPIICVPHGLLQVTVLGIHQDCSIQVVRWPLLPQGHHLEVQGDTKAEAAE